MDTEAANKALVLLVGISLLGSVFLYRIGRLGKAGLPSIEGAIPLAIATAVWLTTAVGTIPFTLASFAVALSVPLVIYGWAEVRGAFTGTHDVA
jgi:hypothetical protein